MLVISLNIVLFFLEKKIRSKFEKYTTVMFYIFILRIIWSMSLFQYNQWKHVATEKGHKCMHYDAESYKHSLTIYNAKYAHGSMRKNYFDLY